MQQTGLTLLAGNFIFGTCKVLLFIHLTAAMLLLHFHICDVQQKFNSFFITPKPQIKEDNIDREAIVVILLYSK